VRQVVDEEQDRFVEVRGTASSGSTGLEVVPPKRPLHRTARGVLWWGAWLLLFLALAGLYVPYVTSWQPPVLLIGDTVVWWRDLVLVIVLTDVACWIASFVLWVSGERTPSGSVVGKVASAVVRFMSVAAVAVSGLALLAAAYSLSAVQDRVLDPASPGGCRIIVRQTEGFIVTPTRGDVYLAVPGSVVLQPTATSWSPTDPGGFDRLTAGTWSLTWDGANADLHLWGQDTRIACPVQ
jgi:hypothetical protein